MTRTRRAPRTNREEASRKEAILTRLDDLYARLDTALANVQHYANFAGDTGTFLETYNGDVEDIQGQIESLEARL